MEQQLRKIIAKNMRVERARRDWTQEYLAEITDISTKHITKIENEKVTPSIYLVYKIAQAFNITIDKLVNPEV